MTRSEVGSAQQILQDGRKSLMRPIGPEAEGWTRRISLLAHIWSSWSQILGVWTQADRFNWGKYTLRTSFIFHSSPLLKRILTKNKTKKSQTRIYETLWEWLADNRLNKMLKLLIYSRWKSRWILLLSSNTSYLRLQWEQIHRYSTVSDRKFAIWLADWKVISV